MLPWMINVLPTIKKEKSAVSRDICADKQFIIKM